MHVESVTSIVSRPSRWIDSGPKPFEKATTVAEPVQAPIADATAPVDESVAPAADEPAVDEPSGEEKAAGVLRLLEAGHFKGVADVRLRINFFDELSERATANAAAASEHGAGELVGAVDAKVEELFAGLVVDDTQRAALDELAASFEAAVAAASETNTASGTFDAEALSAAIQAAYESLASGLQGLFQAPAAEEPAAEAPEDGPAGEVVAEASPADVIDAATMAELAEVAAMVDAEVVGGNTGDVPDVIVTPADGVDGAIVDDAATTIDELPGEIIEPVDSPVADAAAEDPLAAALEDLRAAFDELLAQLTATVDQAAMLPDPAPPKNGNGAAYDKFLAIYNDLRSLSPEVNVTA